MSRFLTYGLAGLVYIFAQVMLFNHLTIMEAATPFVFLLFLFTLPLATPLWLSYILAFVVGLTVDILSEAAPTGLHAFSCVLAISLRAPWAAYITASNFRSLAEINFSNQSVVWFASFLLPLIFVHHLAYFLLEAMQWSLLWVSLGKVILSTLYSFLLIFILTYLFYRK